MKFSLYLIERPQFGYPTYDVEIDGSVCLINDSTIDGLLRYLQSCYTGKVESLLFNPSIVYPLQLLYQDTACNTITHLLTIEYPNIEAFFKNFTSDVETNYPELLL